MMSFMSVLHSKRLGLLQHNTSIIPYFRISEINNCNICSTFYKLRLLPSAMSIIGYEGGYNSIFFCLSMIFMSPVHSASLSLVRRRTNFVDNESLDN